MTSPNDLVLLDIFLADQQRERDLAMPDHAAFEYFVCENILKDSDLSSDEVTSGIVGGADDGGVDGVYALLDDSLLVEDSEVFEPGFSASNYRRGVELRLHMIQAKTTQSFSETAIDIASSSTRRLLNLQYSRDDLESLYSESLVNRLDLFRVALQRLVRRHPRVHIDFHYATRGNVDDIHPKVQRKSNDLRTQFETTVTGATGRTRFYGARELLQLAKESPTYNLTLDFKENITSTNSHVALVFLRDYIRFLANDRHKLNHHIFNSNVRDYQGAVQVNREMRSTLEDPDSPDFWWLNNGVTIICTKASTQGKTYSLDDVQIVNGLQTSHIIFNELQGRSDDDPLLDRTLLVRILETKDPTTRDRVIRATNSQTQVPMAQLRATDDFQRSIELFFRSKGWFYDRRKNYYRNRGKPLSRIVGIPFLAQATMAVGLSRPDDARARPSSLLKTDDNYSTIFSDRIPLVVYLWAVKIQKEVDAYLQAHSSSQERTDLRFHLAMMLTVRMLGHSATAPEQLEGIANRNPEPTDDDLNTCLSSLRRIMNEMIRDTGESQDKIAKGREFVERILKDMRY